MIGFSGSKTNLRDMGTHISNARTAYCIMPFEGRLKKYTNVAGNLETLLENSERI